MRISWLGFLPFNRPILIPERRFWLMTVALERQYFFLFVNPVHHFSKTDLLNKSVHLYRVIRIRLFPADVQSRLGSS